MKTMGRQSIYLTINYVVCVRIQRPVLSWRCAMRYLSAAGIVGSEGESNLMYLRRCLSMVMQLERLGSFIRRGYANMVSALSTAMLTLLTHCPGLKGLPLW